MKNSSCPAGVHIQSIRAVALHIGEEMRGVCRTVYGHVVFDHMLFAAKGEPDFSIEDVERFLKIMTVRSWTPTVGCVHVDERIFASRLRAGQQNGVSVADNGNMPKRGIIRINH